MQHPLQGIKVLDFSRVVAGPFAGRLLSDLGADVVKVEPPDGDSTRIHGKKIKGISGFFNQQNAGKRNISIDLRAPGAVGLVNSLVAVADILIENYRPGVMGRLGIDYAALRAVNSRIIMLSISGFGHDSPESHRPSYAPVVHAEVGLMHRLAQRNGTAPADLPLSVADTNASLHGVIGVLAALQMAARTGQGQHIDMSMMDATFATDDRSHFEMEDVPNTLPVCPIFDLPFGPVFVATDMKLLYKRLNARCDLADPTPPGADLQTKIATRNHASEQRLKQCQTVAQFAALMDVIDIPWGEVRDPHNLEAQPTLKHRKMIVQIDDRAGGTRPIAQSPYRFSDASSGVRGPAAHRGEHNREVLQDWLQWSDGEINDLVAESLLSASDAGKE
ncbi:MAG: CoA transferase [Proteobacteria bacterium]|nr:CoA transferase [Pseudomonadota bacterium]